MLRMICLYLKKERMHFIVKGEDIEESVIDIISQFPSYSDVYEALSSGATLRDKQLTDNGLYRIPCPSECKYIIIDLDNPNRSYSTTNSKYRTVLEECLVRYNNSLNQFSLLQHSDAELLKLLRDKVKIVRL